MKKSMRERDTIKDISKITMRHTLYCIASPLQPDPRQHPTTQVKVTTPLLLWIQSRGQTVYWLHRSRKSLLGSMLVSSNLSSLLHWKYKYIVLARIIYHTEWCDQTQSLWWFLGMQLGTRNKIDVWIYRSSFNSSIHPLHQVMVRYTRAY